MLECVAPAFSIKGKVGTQFTLKGTTCKKVCIVMGKGGGATKISPSFMFFSVIMFCLLLLLLLLLLMLFGEDEDIK